VGINRVAQIFRPLLAIAQNGKTRTIIAGYAQKSQNFLKAFRSHSYEEQILSVIAELLQSKSKLSIKAITASYQKKYGKHQFTLLVIANLPSLKPSSNDMTLPVTYPLMLYPRPQRARIKRSGKWNRCLLSPPCPDKLCIRAAAQRRRAWKYNTALYFTYY